MALADQGIQHSHRRPIHPLNSQQPKKNQQDSGALQKLRQELEEAAAAAAAKGASSSSLASLSGGGAGASPEQREAALLAAAQLCRAAGRAAEPYALPMLPLLLDALADKVPAVRQAAQAALDALAADALCPAAAALALPVLLDALDEARGKWQSREGALKFLGRLAADAPAQVQARLPDIVPVVSTATMDPKPQVAQAAADAGAACFALVGNRDIAHLVGDLLHCVSRADELPDVVQKLSAATFVQSVEAPALAVMVPLLVRGLRDENQTPIKRKCCVIIANMTKLVASPADVLNFLPKLVPGVEKLARIAADPELRETASGAQAILEKASREAKEHSSEAAAAALSREDVASLLAEAAAGACGAEAAGSIDSETAEHVSALCASLAAARSLAFDEWREATVPYLASFAALGGEGAAEGVGRALLSKCADRLSSGTDAEDLGWAPDPEDDPNARELCSCRFSLAYGGKILLNGATLRLVQGRRYGLCGANGAGKSTLMRAISRGQLEGFPSPDELRTIYVEHDIQAALESLGVVDYVAQDPAILALKPKAPTRDECEAQLRAVGFDDDLLSKAITSLSGGWKMKLALARAVLLKADILLLDEVRIGRGRAAPSLLARSPAPAPARRRRRRPSRPPNPPKKTQTHPKKTSKKPQPKNQTAHQPLGRRQRRLAPELPRHPAQRDRHDRLARLRVPRRRLHRHHPLPAAAAQALQGEPQRLCSGGPLREIVLRAAGVHFKVPVPASGDAGRHHDERKTDRQAFGRVF
jgi:elongation factor 3